ncbi:uncharacterized protein E0L32_010553 [Thyridium curvatum]|uniref:PIN-like protein n=1 Tax=Thyridium curvatum TaxID=1093900 RepID=A0A507AS86_9PEZI|nr:uncharacterized protein E0L32_010553 [Thyridium curvatum]TPX07761.1 hypothetical protein E0L32_010553 [Thyridium curvatum]
MATFTSPKSFRIAEMQESMGQLPFVVFKKNRHETHPSMSHLVLLVFEAVMEVVCVSLPGYIVARLGHFDADKQKFLANLNVMLFTPCLIFTKLASQLNSDKLLELAIIPVIFVIQTLVSLLVSRLVSKVFGFNKRASNFVTAMGVFGNSNSLPISLVLSLSQTISGLHWDRIPGDNDDEVGARGILYLLVFQQLGQLVRWSWGYHVLLAPKSKYPEYCEENAEEGRYRDDPDEEDAVPAITGVDPALVVEAHEAHEHNSIFDDSDGYEPAGRTPVGSHSRASPNDSEDDEEEIVHTPTKKGKGHIAGPINGDYRTLSDGSLDGMLSFPRIRNNDDIEIPEGLKGVQVRVRILARKTRQRVTGSATKAGSRVYASLPSWAQKTLIVLHRGWLRFYAFLWEFMNPPLWAMLIAIVVASIPELQKLFFKEGSFVKNSVTSAVSQSAGVAVPLILVVLGANLARNTQNHDSRDPEEAQIGKRLLVASLVSRMLLPTLVMAPVLALFAKFVPISILDDPIFVIVCFLLTGAPSALQLAQICQINGVYESVMGRILFQSYVIWILPSTLVLVMMALEVVEWAK